MITATCRLLFPINRKQLNPRNFFCTREFASAQDFTTSKSKQGVEKDSLPLKPKKPLNVFLLYYNSIRSKLQEEYPQSKSTELVKKASEKWAQIDPMLKQNLQKQYLEQTSVYKQKLMDYENSLTDEQKMEIVQQLLKKGHTLKKGEIKQKLMELGKPKRPLSAFMLFLQSKRVAKKPQVSHKDWINSVTEEWKDLTLEAKNKYSAEAKDLYEKYKVEVKKWEEDMIQADRRHGSADVLYDNKDTLQPTMEHPRNTAMDTSINDVKKTVVQPHDTHIHTQIYTYFISTWNRALTALKEISENWKTKLY
ncbi:PREDICTED: transcription factor A, mitochondrial isoform X2 [Vollenhovia emeryi]|uniref:transcription factor A, mitochondrial isoform X2 n=1 Tax=Vollenhovia emeryi TaxID=411798 RepID=UPI0005F3C4B1|nr:PREDICTED: transcription factor A, mitochondrial isoform X2 [Vollenhovia emeryi]